MVGLHLLFRVPLRPVALFLWTPPNPRFPNVVLPFQVAGTVQSLLVLTTALFPAVGGPLSRP